MTTNQALLLPMFLHIGWVLMLYAWLTWMRVVAVRRGEAKTDDFARRDGDPPFAARIARNLANQFELPLFAWVAIWLLGERVGGWDVAAAWLFLGGRIVHTLVQTLTDDVALRGRVYMITFVAVVWLLGHAAWLALGSAG